MEHVEVTAGKAEVFEMGCKPLFYSREQRNYLQDQRSKLVWHTNVEERVIYFMLKELSSNTMLVRMCYDVSGDINFNAIWMDKSDVQCPSSTT